MASTDTANGEGDGMVCSEDGIVVRVRPREARGDVPAYEYVVRSERHGPVDVRIRQAVPGDVDETDLGFPSACEEHWRLEGSVLLATLRVEAGDQVQTVWGVRDDEHPSIDPPTIDVSPVDRDAEEVSSDEGAVEPQGTLDLDDPSGSSDGGIGGVTDGGTGAATGASLSVGGDTLVGQLLEELESGTVDPAQRSALADALELHASDSANAFVEHVQSKVERRTDRLEGEIQSIEDSVDQLYGVKADSSELSSLKRGITELDDNKVGAGELRDVRKEIKDVQSTVGALAKRVEQSPDAEELAAVEERLDDVAGATQGMHAQLESLEKRIDHLGQRQDELEGDTAAQADLEEVRDAHRNRVNSVTSNVSSLRKTVENDYITADQISAEIDRRLNAGAASLLLFAIGAVGLVATVALAMEGAPAAAGTFAGGAVAMLLWLRLLRADGDVSAALSSIPGFS